MPFSTLFLDLDGTLYPNDNGLWEAIGDRILQFMMSRLDLSFEQADQLRARYLQDYGTTLNGLMVRHQADPMEYLEYVHDLPLERYLAPNPQLRTMLSSLMLKRIIFTNGDHHHAARVLQYLKIEDLIDSVVDILAMEFNNKPHPLAYQYALQAAGETDPGNCIFADDRLENLLPARQIGMTSVLVGAPTQEVDYSIGDICQLPTVLPALWMAAENEGPND